MKEKRKKFEVIKNFCYPLRIRTNFSVIYLFSLEHYYPGTFYQFGNPGIHRVNRQGIRGLLYIDNTLWIANEDLNGILVVDINSGVATDHINVHNPISMFHDTKRNVVFASSKKKHWKGAVYAIDPNTKRITKAYRHSRVSHPSGLFVYEDKIYVGLNDEGKVIVFNVSSAELLEDVIEDTLGPVEQLIISNC